MSKQQSNKNGVGNNEWETPDSLFKELDKEFNFDWDLACTSKNCKTKLGSMIDYGLDGLKFNPGKDHYGYSIWCNPPYDISTKPKFIKKCYELSKLPNVKNVVLLIPAATETELFHKLIVPNCEVRLIHKRVRFMGINTKGKYVTDKTGQSGSMICIFNRLPIIKPYELFALQKDGEVKEC